jgi:uncharacterized protein (DUF433 family)
VQTVLSLTEVREALASGGWVALKKPRVHIEINPDRLSGHPTIRGRRVPTSLVADVANRDDGRTVLRSEFGLSDDEIDDAVASEDDVEKALAA